jgi:hypothetical protein
VNEIKIYITNSLYFISSVIPCPFDHPFPSDILFQMLFLVHLIILSPSEAELTDIEKRSIYEPCIPYFLSSYNLKEVEVIGLLVGARGSIPAYFVKFCKRFKLSSSFIYNIVLLALKGSIAVFRNHLYGQGRIAQ